MWFGRKGKVSPHFIGLYEIIRRNRKVAYELKLPSEMAMVHLVFHISILRLYKPDPSHVLTHEDIEINKGLSYEEEPVQILDRQVRWFRTKDVASMKVLWRNHNTEETTWEAKEDMKKRYPQLFPMKRFPIDDADDDEEYSFLSDDGAEFGSRRGNTNRGYEAQSSTFG
ncbi:uncharacterized protein LOC132064054 [Lycium ferocissimum]|uniref:uncharacterized protein LOC132064054 n=1 Tax=Lycium ferocissimum TaxID=112874 RepID=UPI002815C08C|nr:uncharacterized protein LOC132064054 [Lycium ferocissimum]